MKILHMLSSYRWPLLLGGLLVMSVSAQGILVYVATRPDVPQPIEGYYEKSQKWDEDSALRAASKQLGWRVTFDVPGGEQYQAGMPRPVDVRIVKEDGEGVSGLQGEIQALRPANRRSLARGKLTELPHAPGSYRTLVTLDAPGMWELSVDAHKGEVRFVHSHRLSVASTGQRGGADG